MRDYYNRRYGEYGTYRDRDDYGRRNSGRRRYDSDFDDDFRWGQTKNYEDDYRWHPSRSFGDEYRENRFGGYGDSDYHRRYSENRNYDRDRDYDRHDEGDRNFWQKAGDEVRSWFGGDDSGRNYERDRDYNYNRDRDYNDSWRYGQHRYRENYNRGESDDFSTDRGRRRFEEGQRQNYIPGSAIAYSAFWVAPGPYSGMGPKGYERTGDRIREEVNERLYHNGRIDASDIEVSVDGDEVTLSGTVENREMKHLAEEIAESVYGVNDVHNHLRIKKQERSFQSGEKQFQQGDRGSQQGYLGSTSTTAESGRPSTKSGTHL